MATIVSVGGEAVGSLRTRYTRTAQEIIEKHKDDVIMAIQVHKEPLSAYVDMLLNILSLGQWSNHTDIFHIRLILVCRNQEGVKYRIRVEKMATVEVKEETHPHPPGKKVPPIKLEEALKNTEKKMGDTYFTYDPLQNNCQDFALNFLLANGIHPEEPVKQDLKKLLQDQPSWMEPVTKVLMDMKCLYDVLTK